MINSIMVSPFFFFFFLQAKDCLRLSDQNIQPFIGPTVKKERLCIWHGINLSGWEMNTNGHKLMDSLKKLFFMIRMNPVAATD